MTVCGLVRFKRCERDGALIYTCYVLIPNHSITVYAYEMLFKIVLYLNVFRGTKIFDYL